MKNIFSSLSKKLDAALKDTLNIFQYSSKAKDEFTLPTQNEISEMIKSLDGCRRYRTILWQKRDFLAGKLYDLQKPADFGESVDTYKISSINIELLQINAELAGINKYISLKEQSQKNS